MKYPPKPILSFSITITCFLWCYSCNISLENQNKISPHAPIEFVNYNKIGKNNLNGLLSNICLPIAVFIGDIEEKINTEIKNNQSLHQDTAFKTGKRAKIKFIYHKVGVRKTADFEIDVKDGYIYARLPLHIDVGLKYGLNDEIALARKPIETAAYIDVYARTKVELNEAWEPIVNLEVVDYKWITYPKINILKQEVSVTKIAEKRIEKILPHLLPNLNEIVRQKIDIETPLRAAWIAMQEPQLIAQTPQVWLKMQPFEVAVSPLQAQKDTLKISVGVKVFAETIIGQEPMYHLNTKLPKLSFLDKLKDNFHIQMTASVSYKRASALAKKELIGYKQNFLKGKYHIQVSDIEIYPSGTKLVAKVDIEGSLTGTIYLKGKPTYDAELGSFYIKNFDFDIKTANMLANVANWLQHKSLVKTLESKLYFPLDETMDEAKCQLQELLNNQTIGRKRNIVLNGDLEELEPVQVSLTDSEIKATVMAKGNAEMYIGID
ncbi:MAG: DUF4403 family protein [Chitinophagales bacterium]